MPYTKEELIEMTGEKSYKRPKVQPLNKITFNGKDGKFVYTDMLSGKDVNGKYQKKEIGKDIQVVFLKIRRILFKFRKNQPSLSTSEHNEPNDTVMLFGVNEKGTARSLREKYPELRTQQVVYAYIPHRDEVVRLIVKGASLGSNNKSKETLGFYEYLATFTNDEHIYERFTVLSPAKESSDVGDYYAINFKKGDLLDEQTQVKAIEKLGEIHKVIKEFDEYYKTNEAKDIINDAAPQVDTTDYPEEEIDPEEIPF